MQAYKEAFDAATLANDTLLVGRIMQYIGSLFYNQGIYKEALIAYKKAADISVNIIKRKAEYYGNIGRCFILMNETDSAIYYLKEGVNLAAKTDYKKIQNLLLQNLSVVYLENQMYDNALLCLRQSKQNNSIYSPQDKLAFGKLFLAINQTDSVEYYIKLLKDDLNKLDSTNISDLYTAASIYAFFVKNHNKNKQYDSAFYYQQKYMNLADKIYNNNLQKSIYEVQQKYDFEAEQNKHNLQQIKLQKQIINWIVVLLIAIVFIFIFGVKLFRKTKKTSNLMTQLFILQKENTELNEQQEMLNGDIDRMKQEMAELEKENNDLQKTTKINEINQKNSNLKSELERSAIQLENNMIWRISLLCQVANNDNTPLVPKEAQLKQIRKAILDENKSSWESIIELCRQNLSATYTNH